MNTAAAVNPVPLHRTTPRPFDDCEERVFVCDFGSETTKAGFSGDDYPQTVFPSIIGRVKPGIMASSFNPPRRSHYFVGDDAEAKRGILSVTHPIERGVFANWGDVEKIMHHTFFDELRSDSDGATILVAEPPLNSEPSRERMCQKVFEQFRASSFFAAPATSLALYATGRTEGLVLDCGDGLTCATPHYEGYSMPHATLRVEVGGRDLDLVLQRKLIGRGLYLATSSELRIVKEIKQRMCFVAPDFDVQQREPEELLEYELPDGTVIQLGCELYQCPEALFQPHGAHGSNFIVSRSGTSFDTAGLAGLVNESIARCDPDMRADLRQNVLLCGGSTMFRGLPERLERELQQLSPRREEVKVVAQPDRKYSTWIGGSILSTLSTFQQRWITKAEYDEYGPGIMRWKCW